MMDEETRKIILEERKRKEDKYKNLSKERLKENISKKILTTTVGAVSSIEKFFGFLWKEEIGGKLSEEQAYMKNLFGEVREEIFALGNRQIKNAETEIENHDISWNRYHQEFPIGKAVVCSKIKENRNE